MLLRVSCAFLLFSCSLAVYADPDAGLGQTQADVQQKADGIKTRIDTNCKFDANETDLKKIRAVNRCIAKAVETYRQQIRVQVILAKTAQSAAAIAVGVGLPPKDLAQQLADAGRGGGHDAPPAAPPGGTTPGVIPQQLLMTGGSLSNTPSTCGEGHGSNNPAFIRVHRTILTPQTAADDFGRRLGRRFIVYQVTVENDNPNYQYMLHDVTIDFSSAFLQTPGTYQFNASGMDLSLLRGVPEKGQDLDPRNSILHVLQGVGSVAGAVSGLTAFSDVMGSSMAVFNGSFLQSYSAIAPDHTGTQLNRLSDSAFMANTVIDKQRAKTIALFVPEDEILSKKDREKYWRDATNWVSFNDPTSVLNAADICVDGTFIQAVNTGAPTLITAVLTNGTSTFPAALPGATTPLAVTGTNLVQGDTQVILTTAMGSIASAMLMTADSKTGTAQITLPNDFTTAATVQLRSKSDPTMNSGVGTKVGVTALPTTLTTVKSTPAPTAGGTVTLTIMGTNLLPGDTQIVVGTGPAVDVTTTDGFTGTATNVTLPSNFAINTATGQAVLKSKSNTTLASGTVAVQ